MKLVLLPHFDDEVFFLPLFASNHEKLRDFLFLFIMRGCTTRKRESLAYMASFGIGLDQVLFLDDVFEVHDGEVVFHLNEIFEGILSLLSKVRPQILFGTAWEGGHQDHDAVFVLTRALASHLGVESFHFFTYNGYRTRGHWFRVIHPIDAPEDGECRRISFSVVIRALFGIWFFSSQWRSWIGIFPLLATKLLVFRKLYLVNGRRTKLRRPHAGPLLYERYGRMSYHDFQITLREFEFIRKTKVFPELEESSLL